MKKIVFLLTALLLAGCSEPPEAPKKAIKTTDADIGNAQPNSPQQDAKPTPKKSRTSEGDEYMRTHTPKQNKNGWETEGVFK